MGNINRRASFTLPVVIHIIHNEGIENISDNQAKKAIDYLNNGFENSGYYDPLIGVNTQIQFCLAKRSPTGEATSAINRIRSSLTDLNHFFEDEDLKNLSRWPPLDYINIWVVREICNSNGCGVAGYAYLPSAHGETFDGIVIESAYMGSNEASTSVLIHEMGHFLGLSHTFQDGCNNNDCLLDGDKVCDTPPDNTTVRVPCNDPLNSCNSDSNSGFTSDQIDLINNYMDYSNLECYNAFTQGQTDRMHYFIENDRASLLESKGCIDPCPVLVKAWFNPGSNQTILAGESISFTNNSTNADNFQWQINGIDISSSVDLNYQFLDIGIYTVTLRAENNFPNCFDDSFSIQINVICPAVSNFDLSTSSANIGESLIFTNTSQNANAFEWLVNGAFQSSTSDFTFESNTAGLFEVCLIASNSFCSEEKCLWIEFESDTPDCEKASVSFFGNVGRDEISTAILPSLDGNLIIGGEIEDKVSLSKFTTEFEQIWTKEFDITGFPDERIEKMFWDSDGYLVVCGSAYSSVSVSNAFIFKYDPRTEEMIWVTVSDRSYGLVFADVNENPINGNYLVSGQNYQTDCRAVFIEYDKISGLKIGSPLEVDIGSCDSYLQFKFHKSGILATGRFTFGGSLSDMRPILSFFDMDLNPIWNKSYLVGPSANARLYCRDFFIDGDEIYSEWYGHASGTNASRFDLFLAKSDDLGNLKFVKRFNFPGIGFTGNRILKAENYVFLTGIDNIDKKFIVIKTDLDGNLIWAFKIKNKNAFNLRGNHIFATADKLFLTYGFNVNDEDFALIKIPVEGKPDFENCLDVEFLTATTTDYQNPFEENFNINPKNFSFQNNSKSPEDGLINLDEYILCQSLCSEICNNGIDDDQDGLIDCFDPDCGCVECEDFYFTSCVLDSCVLKADTQAFEIKEKWRSTLTKSTANPPVVGDLDGDGMPEILLVGNSTDNSGVIIYRASEIYIYSGDGSNMNSPFVLNVEISGNGGNILLADLNRDRKSEIVVIDINDKLRIFSNYTGVSVSEWPLNADSNIGLRGSPNAADFNNDGIPEIYIGNEIFGFDQGFSSLTKFLEGNGAIGRREISAGSIIPIAPVVADVLSVSDCNGDPDCSGLELICGPEVYSVDLNLSDGDGFELKLQRNADDFSGGLDMGDGATGVADMNLDGSLDVIVNGSWNCTFGTYIYNPSKSEFYLKVPSLKNNGNAGSLGKVSIGNVFDDRSEGFLKNYPEVIAVCADWMYTINLNQASQVGANGIWWSNPIIDPSAVTGATCFDFNGDGLSEIVYRDEENVRIMYGGNEPFPLGVDSERNWSKINGGARTGTEHPIVADVDNTGSSEIILIAGDTRDLNGTLRVYESGLKPWFPFRPVWNQQQYFNVNINDNLTVPQVQQFHHLTDGEEDLNIFLAQYGNSNFPVPDAYVQFDSTYCNGDSLRILFTICNSGSNTLPRETPVVIYDDNPEIVNATPISIFEIGQDIEVGECQSFSKNLKVTNSGTFYILVNSDNDPLPPYNLVSDFSITHIRECNYEYNIIEFPVVSTEISTIDLPEDIVVCPNEAFTIRAITNSVNYRWQDGSTDSTYTIFEEGVYWCCVSSGCGTEVCDSITIVYDKNVSVDLGGDRVICEGENLTISPTNFINSKIRWYPKNAVSCDTCISNLIAPNINTTYVVVSETDSGCISVDSMEVMVNPSFAFYDSIQFCIGDTVRIKNFEITRSGTVEIANKTENGCDSIYYYEIIEAADTIFENSIKTICNGDSILIFGSHEFESGIYSQIDSSLSCVKVNTIEIKTVSKPASFDTIVTCLGIPISIFNFQTDVSGTYTGNFPSQGPCDSIHQITLVAKDTFFNFSNIEICSNEKANIFGTLTNIPGMFSNRYIAANGCDSLSLIELIVSDTLISVDTFSICENDSMLIFGNYETSPGIYSETSQGVKGCDSTSYVILNKNGSIDFQIDELPACFEDNSGSGGVMISNGTPPFYFIWEDNSTDSIRNSLSAGIYYFTLTDNIGCQKADSIIIENEDFSFELELDTPLCFGEENASIRIITDDLNLEFSLNGTEFSQDSVFNNLGSGNYTISAVNPEGCRSDKDIEILLSNPIWVSLPGDTIINIGDEISIAHSTNIRDGDYSWEPASLVDCPTCPKILSRPFSETIFTLSVTDQNGCVVLDSILVGVKPEKNYYAPSAFSPNNDGINDFFTIYGDATLINIESLNIFDQWGDFIWEGKNLKPNESSQGWSGKFKNKKLNSGVFAYFAVLKYIDGSTLTIKGDFTLIY